MTGLIERSALSCLRGTISRRQFFRQAAAFGIGSGGALTLLGSAAAAAGPQKGGTLRAAMAGGEATDTLDPAQFSNPVVLTFGRCWAEQLLELSADGELEPRLAEAFEPADRARKWVFRIRKGVTFHNGKTLTPQDVAETYRRHSDPASASTAYSLTSGFETVEADGDNVIITLREANVDLPYLLTDFHLMIQPDGGWSDPTSGIGTGPYRVVVDEPGSRYVGERYSDYWAPDQRGHVDQVEILVVNDTTSRTLALQSGQVDIINRVDPKTISLLQAAQGVTVRNVAGRGHYYMVAHCDAAPFDNNDLRMALKLAVDRQELVDKILGGYGAVGNDTPVMNAYPLFSEEIEQRAYDPDRAAFHYRKSGHSGPVVLHTSEVAFPGAVDTAQLYRESAARAGIDIEIRREPSDGYWSDVWNKVPLCMTFIFGRPTQDQVYSLMYLSDSEWNDTRFFREDFDRLILGARSELDPALRKEMYRDATMILRDEGGAIIPMFGDFIDGTGPRVQGWEDNPNAELMGGQAFTRCWLADA